MRVRVRVETGTPRSTRLMWPASMPGSILHTAEVPAFDPRTGQLSLASHDLISAPLSLADVFPPEYTLLFDPSPSRPYGTSTSAADADQPAGQSRRKRRRLARPDETASPLDWIRHREKEATRSSTDKESDEHHAAIEAELGTAVEAVRAGWMGKGENAWMGESKGRYEWREKEDEDVKEELDLVGLGERFAPALDEPPEPLLLSESRSTVSAAALFHRIVRNDGSSCISLDIEVDASEATPTSKATVILPPSSGFLLSQLATWPASAPSIASLGGEKGGWDVLIVESVLASSATCSSLADAVALADSPPWPNASATRSSSYDTFDPYDLWKLDLPTMLGDSPTLVAFWLTNRVKVRLPQFSHICAADHLCAVPTTAQGQALPGVADPAVGGVVLDQDRLRDGRASVATRRQAPSLLRRCVLLPLARPLS